jgi:hypothetical protein
VSRPVVSNVTVSFLCTPGSAPIVFCPAPQLVSTEGALQLITGTAMDANGLTADTRQFIGLDKTKPALSVTSPADGSLFTTATIAVTGTASDALSGVDTVTCNGFFASLSGGNFSCNISLNPGVNLLVVRATDRAGNVSASISHVTLDVPLPAPVSLKITPGGATLLVGETQQFTAVDENDHRRTDATWTVSDTTIATITTASSPVLTAIAVGQVTLTANVAGASAQVQINALGGSLLPAGTVRWVAPSTPGFAVSSVIQAEPVDGAPDLYSLEVNNDPYQVIIRALTADGQQLWASGVVSSDGPANSGSLAFNMMADGRGGVLLIAKGGDPFHPRDNGLVMDLDGQTGSLLWQFLGNTDVPDPGFAVGPDGTIYFTVLTDWWDQLYQYPESLMAMDPTTGAVADIYDAPGVPGPPPPFSGNPPFLSHPTVGPDGSVFVLLSTLQGTQGNLSLVRVTPGGGTEVTLIHQSDNYTIPDLVIPDGQGGTYAAWHDSDSGGPHISHGSSDVPIPLNPREMALGDNGDAYVVGTDPSTGNETLFSLQGWSFSVQEPDQLHIVGVVAGGGGAPGGGVIVNDLQQGLIPFDASGNQGTPSGTPVASIYGPMVTPFALGNYVGPVGGSLAMFKEPAKDPSDTSSTPSLGPLFADSAFPYGGGTTGGQNATPKLTIKAFVPAQVLLQNAPNQRFGSDQQVKTDFQQTIPATSVDQQVFTSSIQPLATIDNFLLGTITWKLNAMAFIGHANVVTSFPNFADGLIFKVASS